MYLQYCKDREKDTSLPPQPEYRDPLVKIETGLKEADYMKIIKHDAECRLWQLKRQNAVHDKRLAHLFLEKAGIKYQEFRNGLENDWNKKKNTYPKTVQEAYTLLETYKGSEKCILHIVQKGKQNDRSDTNSNSKTKSGIALTRTERAVSSVYKAKRTIRGHV